MTVENDFGLHLTRAAVRRYWPGIHVHYVSSEVAIASRGYELLIKEHDAECWRHLTRVPVPLIRRLLFSSGQLRTLLRRGIRCLLPISSDRMIVFCDRTIFYFETGWNAPRAVGRIRRGNGPLFQGCCTDSAGTCYYGEYSGTRERIETHVWYWRPGWAEWRIFYSFPAGSIRHVHSVLYDVFSDRIWVTTGDHDDESRIGYFLSSPNGPTFHNVASGQQAFRAVSLLFTRDHVHWGSDAQDRVNTICRLARVSGTIEILAEVDGPVFYSATDAAGRMFVSTGAERMRGLESRVGVWMTEDSRHWNNVGYWAKHGYPTVLGRDVFGHGTLSFPAGSQFCELLYVAGHSVQGAPGTWLLQL